VLKHYLIKNLKLIIMDLEYEIREALKKQGSVIMTDEEAASVAAQVVLYIYDKE